MNTKMNTWNRLCAFVTLAMMLIMVALPMCATAEYESAEPPTASRTLTEQDVDDNIDFQIVGTSTEIGPMWSSTAAVSTNLTIKDDGSYVATGTITASSSSYSVTISLVLQKKNGSKWDNVNSWSGSGKGATDAYGTGKVSSGTYRTQVTTKSNGEQVTAYSKEKVRP